MIFVIHREQPGGRSADGGLAGDASCDSLEVLFPNILARMEETAHFAGVGIDAREVRAFVQIAARTGKGEVFQDRGSAVLPRDDVLDVEGHQRLILMHSAVFAAVARTLFDELPKRAGDHCCCKTDLASLRSRERTVLPETMPSNSARSSAVMVDSAFLSASS